MALDALRRQDALVLNALRSECIEQGRGVSDIEVLGRYLAYFGSTSRAAVQESLVRLEQRNAAMYDHLTMYWSAGRG